MEEPSKHFRILREPQRRSPQTIYYATIEARNAAAQKYADRDGIHVFTELWTREQARTLDPINGGWATDGAAEPTVVKAVLAELGADAAHIAAVLFPKDQEHQHGTFYHGGEVTYIDGRPPARIWFEIPVWQALENTYGNVGWYDGLAVIPAKRQARRGSHAELEAWIAAGMTTPPPPPTVFASA